MKQSRPGATRAVVLLRDHQRVIHQPREDIHDLTRLDPLARTHRLRGASMCVNGNVTVPDGRLGICDLPLHSRHAGAVSGGMKAVSSPPPSGDAHVAGIITDL